MKKNFKLLTPIIGFIARERPGLIGRTVRLIEEKLYNLFYYIEFEILEKFCDAVAP